MPKVLSTSLIEKLREGNFVTTAELEVSSSTSIDGLLDKAKNLQNRVDAIIIGRDPKASLYLNPLIPCYLIKEKLSLESIYSLDSRDKNRLGLFSDILTASQLGLSNIIVSTGTHTTTSTYDKAKPVFDLDAIQLITMIKKMNDGRAFTGEAIWKPTTFDVGAVLGSDQSRPEMEEISIQKQKNAGASYFLTLPIYDSERAKMIANQTSRTNIPLIVTIYPIDSIETVDWINKIYPAAKPPEDFVDRIKNIEQSSSKSTEKNKIISDTNIKFVNTLMKELRALKGVSGCNIVSNKLDLIKTPFP